MGRTLLVLAACTAAIAGCGSSGDDSSTSTPAGTVTAAAPKPTVAIIAPTDGATTSRTVTARVKLTDFVIDPRSVGQAPRPGRGHLHWAMDEGRYDYPKYSGKNGLLAKKLDVAGHYSPGLSPEITYKRLPPGKHELEVYLANNNHTNVGVEAKVEFTVK